MDKTNKGGVPMSRRVLSALLALISAFAVIVAAIGVKDTLAVKSYLEETDTAEAIRQINTLKDGVQQLSDNEDAYFSGAEEYDAGVLDYEQGQKDLAQGAKDLAQGKKDLVAGQAEYDAGVKELAAGKKELADGAAQIKAGEAELAAGKKELAEGQKQIDENTQAYNEGKEQLAQIEPLMPYVDQYVEFRDNNLSSIAGFDTAQSWFAAVVKPIANQAGLEVPDDVTDFPKYIQDMVADGKAQLKEYEDGLVALEEGKKQIAAGEAELAQAYKDYAAGEQQLKDGEAQLAAGKKELDQGYKDYAQGQKDYADGQVQLADGAQQLKDGAASLAEFEDGVQQIKDGLKELLGQAPVYSKNGVLRVKGVEQALGYNDFTAKDGVKMHNGETYIDLSKATAAANATLQYIDDSEVDATNEIVARIVLNGILLIAGILGLIAGIIGLKGKGTVLAIITAILSVIGTGYGFAKHFFDWAYTLKDGTYVGNLQSVTLILLAVVSVIAAIVFWPTRVKKDKAAAKASGAKAAKAKPAETKKAEKKDDIPVSSKPEDKDIPTEDSDA